MDPIASTIIVIGLAVSLLYYYSITRKINFLMKSAPGPWGVPILGYLPFLRKDVHRQFQELSVKHGKVFLVKIGTKSVLVLNDWTSIKEALVNQSDTFSNRAFMISSRIREGHKVEIAGQNDSPITRHQRRFAIKTLRSMGMGNSYGEMVILEEAQKLIAQFSSHSGKIIISNGLFFVPAANIILKISIGERFEYGSKEADNLSYAFRKVVEFIAQANIINIFPILRFFSSSCSEYKINTDIIKGYMSKAIEDHRLVYSMEYDPKDYTESYLQQMYNMTFNIKSDELCSFSDERLLGDLVNFFNAGSDTTATTMSWAILYMSLWSNIQNKVQAEIDSTIGKNEFPRYKDRQILPYTNAVILEVQRYASMAPFSVPRMTKTATNLCGLHIPAHTTVWANLWAVHHDPELWGDPEIFRPERFFDADGKVFEPVHFIPFSVGSRRCIGELLARMEMFLFFSSLMQKFTFRIPDGYPPPSLDPIPGGVLRPYPHSVFIEQRV